MSVIWRRYKILYEHADSGRTAIFAYVAHPHGGVWLHIAKLLKWVKNPRVVEAE